MLKQVLPENFSELLITSDLSELKAIFNHCDLNARGGYSNYTALSYRNISMELTRWLVENGADLTVQDNDQNTPLHNQAGYWFNTVELLIELGADIEAKDKRGSTPLHSAAEKSIVPAVEMLLAAGANCHVTNKTGRTPIEMTLVNCRNIDIIHASKTVDVLLKNGAVLTEEAYSSVKRIGTDFEFYKEKFNPEYLAETEAGLKLLYKITGIDPVPEKLKHDGYSIIEVAAQNWQEQHEELWQMLVPAAGKAETVQGEIIRLTGKLSHELLGNGGVNWDSDFCKIVQELPIFFQLGDFSFQERLQVKQICQLIPRESEETELERLSELAVQWVLENSKPIKLGKVSYQR